MPTPTKGARLGGSSAHQRHMLANLATALFEHGKITTTEARARRLRPYAERLITFAKRGDLHGGRQNPSAPPLSPKTGRAPPAATAGTRGSRRSGRARATMLPWP